MCNIRFVPEASRSFFSISGAIDKGYNFKVYKNGYYFSKDRRVRIVEKRTSRGLYALKLKVLLPEKSASVFKAVADTM